MWNALRYLTCKQRDYSPNPPPQQAGDQRGTRKTGLRQRLGLSTARRDIWIPLGGVRRGEVRRGEWVKEAEEDGRKRKKNRRRRRDTSKYEPCFDSDWSCFDSCVEVPLGECDYQM